MNVSGKNFLALQVTLGVLMSVAALDPAMAQNVGTAAAANTVSTGTPPGGKNRVIELGAQVVRREKIDTSSSGSVQLLFVDKTTFNIGPSSSVVIDDFVFNPDSDTGRMTATLTKGVLRVVGGQASHTGGTTIRTPSATIGIRGGVATVSYCAAATCAVQGTRVINHFGTLSITSAGGTETIRRPRVCGNDRSAGQRRRSRLAVRADRSDARAASRSRWKQSGLVEQIRSGRRR